MSKESPETEIDLPAMIKQLGERSDASYAIVAGSILEDWLEEAIRAKTIKLSSQLNERLFKGYGPMSTFSGKIDVAYAFGLFKEETYNDLRAIKNIRNRFAHTPQVIHFQSSELTPYLQALTGWEKDCTPYMLYSNRINACVDVLKEHVKTGVFIEMLRNYKPETSTEKSV